MRAGEASEVRVLLADEASALAFARRLTEGPDAQARLRALLAGELGRIHQLDVLAPSDRLFLPDKEPKTTTQPGLSP